MVGARVSMVLGKPVSVLESLEWSVLLLLNRDVMMTAGRSRHSITVHYNHRKCYENSKSKTSKE